MVDVIEDMIAHGIGPYDACALLDINTTTYYKALRFLKRNVSTRRSPEEKKAIVDAVQAKIKYAGIQKALDEVGINTGSFYRWWRQQNGLKPKTYGIQG